MKKEIEITLKKKEIIGLITCSIILLVYTMYKFNSYDMITIVYDEFGYWANASFFVGNDWSGIASTSPYYSYGYSLVLTPLLYLVSDPSVRFKISLIINVFFLITTFILLYDCGKRLFKSMRKKYIMCAAFVTMLYPSYIMNVQFTWVETLLLLIFVTIFWLFLKFEEKNKYRYVLGIGCLTIYSYMVHQRNIGLIIVVLFIFILYSILKEINPKFLLCIVITLILGLLLHRFLKELVYNHVWASMNEAVKNVNEYSGQVEKIKGLFSVLGIKLFLAGIGGRVYYILVGTCGITYFGFRYLAGAITKSFIAKMKKEQKKIENISLLFIILALCAQIVIAVVYMLLPTRIDSLVYGRYFEYELAPFIFIGFLYCISKFLKIKEVVLYLLGLFILTGLLYFTYVRIESSGYTFVTAPAVDYYYQLCGDYTFLFYGSVIASIIFIIINLIRRFLNKKTKVGIILLVGIFFGFMNYHLRQQVLYLQDYYKDTLKITNFLEDSKIESIYCIDIGNQDYENYWYRLGILQYTVADIKLEELTFDEFIRQKNIEMVIVWDDAPYYQEIEEDYTYKIGALGYSVFERK